MKQNKYYNIKKRKYNKEDLETIENKLREDFKKYNLRFDNTITALEIFLKNINKIPNKLQELKSTLVSKLTEIKRLKFIKKILETDVQKEILQYEVYTLQKTKSIQKVKIPLLVIVLTLLYLKIY